jgi:ribulose-phosphate 3-epimerase
MARIAPSVLAADFSCLADDIRDADRCGIDLFHLDIMDGHFVPNISFGPEIVRTIDKVTGTFLDVHLMLSRPEQYFEPFVKAGADLITFHLEVHPDPKPAAKALKGLGVKTGISINPDMPVENVLPHLEHFDYVLLMSVFPGFGGQKFIESVMPKIRIARDFIDDHGLATQVEVDGGVDAGNAASVVSAGAHILVMGTAFFRSPDRAALTRRVHGL